MLYYGQSESIQGLTPAGHASDHGVELIEGNPEISMRVDFGSPEGPVCAGIWACETGKFKLTYPYSELFTLLEGEVIVTDSSGNQAHIKPGDSLFTEVGETCEWEILASCKKSFLIKVG